MDYRISVVFDREASVFVATSEDVPGLVTTAASLDTLHRKVANLIPELMNVDGHWVDPDAHVSYRLDLP